MVKYVADMGAWVQTATITCKNTKKNLLSVNSIQCINMKFDNPIEAIACFCDNVVQGLNTQNAIRLQWAFWMTSGSICVTESLKAKLGKNMLNCSLCIVPADGLSCRQSDWTNLGVVCLYVYSSFYFLSVWACAVKSHKSIAAFL